MKYLKTLNELFNTFKNTEYFKTVDLCVDYGVCISPEWEQSLTDDEKDSISWYRDGGYHEANKYLNDKKDYVTENEITGSIRKISEYVEILHNSLLKTKIKEDVVVYKGVGERTYRGENLFYENIKNLKELDIIDINNLMSTTLHYQYAINAFVYREGLILKINLKKGTNAAYISLDENGSRSENEVLIIDNLKYKVKKIETILYKGNNKEYKLIELDII